MEMKVYQKELELQSRGWIPTFHIIRFGDIAIATNLFELFLDYANRIKARSLAKQTFVMHLTCGDSGRYLPTEKAEQGSHYSAYISSGHVGYEGGEVDREKHPLACGQDGRGQRCNGRHRKRPVPSSGGARSARWTKCMKKRQRCVYIYHKEHRRWGNAHRRCCRFIRRRWQAFSPVCSLCRTVSTAARE